MTLLRGIADDRSLIDWLNNYIFPLEQEFVDSEFVRIGTELACWEMIRGGTTTFVDMYFYPDIISKVVAQCGLRGLISSTVSNNQTPNAENAQDAINGGKEYIDHWKNKIPTITPILGPHAIYTLDLDQLKETRRIANLTDTPISIHLSESEFELNYSKSTYGMTSIEALDSIDFFNGRTIAAHVVWPTKKEIKILAERNVGVIHNPTSNMKLASGIAPITEMLDAGILIGLGTDGAASNNDLDMWEEMRLAALLQKVTKMDPEVLPAITVLRMATANAAKIIGLEKEIGRLEIGMKADIIQVAFDDVHHQPNYDITSHLVYVTDEQDVETVIVDGKLLMHKDQFFTLDTKKISEEVAVITTKIANSIN
jgi:5-methylthioadenosine/S-adenosylhomocysteine deaminase